MKKRKRKIYTALEDALSHWRKGNRVYKGDEGYFVATAKKDFGDRVFTITDCTGSLLQPV